MQEQLVGFEVAELAKEIGFNIRTEWFWQVNKEYNLHKRLSGLPLYYSYGCITYYQPTQSLLQRWLREVFNIDVIVECDNNGSKFYKVRVWSNGDINLDYSTSFKTYEQALEVGLLRALKIIKDGRRI